MTGMFGNLPKATPTTPSPGLKEEDLAPPQSAPGICSEQDRLLDGLALDIKEVKFDDSKVGDALKPIVQLAVEQMRGHAGEAQADRAMLAIVDGSALAFLGAHSISPSDMDRISTIKNRVQEVLDAVTTLSPMLGSVAKRDVPLEERLVELNNYLGKDKVSIALNQDRTQLEVFSGVRGDRLVYKCEDRGETHEKDLSDLLDQIRRDPWVGIRNIEKKMGEPQLIRGTLSSAEADRSATQVGMLREKIHSILGDQSAQITLKASSGDRLTDIQNVWCGRYVLEISLDHVGGKDKLARAVLSVGADGAHSVRFTEKPGFLNSNPKAYIQFETPNYATDSSGGRSIEDLNNTLLSRRLSGFAEARGSTRSLAESSVWNMAFSEDPALPSSVARMRVNKVVFQASPGSESIFMGRNISGSQFGEVEFRGSISWNGLVGPNLRFTKCDLVGVRGTGAAIPNSEFIGCNLGLKLIDSNLNNVDLHDSRVPPGRQLHLENCRRNGLTHDICRNLEQLYADMDRPGARGWVNRFVSGFGTGGTGGATGYDGDFDLTISKDAAARLRDYFAGGLVWSKHGEPLPMPRGQYDLFSTCLAAKGNLHAGGGASSGGSAPKAGKVFTVSQGTGNLDTTDGVS